MRKHKKRHNYKKNRGKCRELFAYLQNSNFAKKFRSMNLSATKRTRLLKYAEFVYNAKINISNEILGTDEDGHWLFKEVYVMSNDEFCKLCRGMFNEKYKLRSTTDNFLYTEIFNALQNRFSTIKNGLRMYIRTYKIKKLNDETIIECKKKSTFVSKLLTFLMSHIKDYTKESTYDYIIKKANEVLDLQGLDEKEIKNLKDLKELYKEFERIIQKPDFYDRLYSLASDRFERLFVKYSYPINFESLNFTIRSRSKNLIGKNKNENSQNEYFIDIGNFDGLGMMYIPIYYSRSYHGPFEKINKTVSSPSYVIHILFNGSYKEIDIAYSIEDERAIPVLPGTDYKSVEEKQKENKEKFNKRHGTRQKSSVPKTDDHYINKPSDTQKYHSYDGIEISADEYISRHTAAHDVNIKHNCISAYTKNETGNEHYFTVDWPRKDFDTYCHLKDIYDSNKKDFEKSKSNRIKHINEKINQSASKEDADKLKEEIEQVKSTHYICSKSLRKALDACKRRLKENTNRNIHKYVMWLLEHNIIHIVGEDLSDNFGKQYAIYKITDRNGKEISINYNNITNFCELSSLNNKIKRIAGNYGICMSFINPAYTSQRCPVCGHIEKANRPNQETFKCKKCTFEENADRVSPRNMLETF